MDSRRGPKGSWVRRTAVLLLGVLGFATIAGAVDVGAQDASAVVRGGANASADSMGFQIVNAGASLGWTFGRANAAYRDITATAEGKSVDLGALGALLGQPQCLGQLPPALDIETLPPQSIADSSAPGSEVAVQATVMLPKLADDNTPTKEVGTQRARATKVPFSEASTATKNQDFGFFKVEGAESEAHTSFENGVRTAFAQSRAARIVVLGGQVVFYGPVWTATAKSGAETSKTATFTFDSASVFGNWVSGATLERDLKIFESLIEGILSPFGLDLEFPEVVPPFVGDGIAMSPLSITMSDAPIGKGLLIPLLDTSILEQYRVETVTQDCRTESFWTILDALERALGGSGSVQTLIGGATATTDATDYSFTPLPENEEPTSAPSEAPTDVSDLSGDFGTEDFGTDFVADDFGTDFSSDFGTDDLGSEDFGSELAGEDLGVLGEDLPAEEVAPAEEIADARSGEELASASGGDDAASNAAAITVGVIALLGAVGLSLGDRVVGIRARRRIT